MDDKGCTRRTIKNERKPRIPTTTMLTTTIKKNIMTMVTMTATIILHITITMMAISLVMVIINNETQYQITK